MEIVFQSLVILPALNQAADFFVKSLNADFKLERACGETGDDFSQRLWQPVRHHFEMEKLSRLIISEKKFQDGPAGLEVEVKGAVHKFELPDSAPPQPI